MKKKIALYANSWNGENLDQFLVGVREVMSEDEYDIFIFASRASYSLSAAEREAENAIYFMIDVAAFDAVIIYASGLNSDASLQKLIKNCQEAGVPFVVQGYKGNGFRSVTVDNYIGMKNLCDHLIDVHGVKKIEFIAGPKDNEDSNERIRAVRDSLAAHGLELKDESIFYANWERKAVEQHISECYGDGRKPLPDAFVCANDPMAIFLLLALEAFGYSMPEDVIVSGFDNLRDGRLFYPSVASVDQRYYDQGRHCAQIIVKNSGESVVVPCVAAFGESCGCMNCKKEAEGRRGLGHDIMSRRIAEDALRGRVAHLEMNILSCENYEDIPEKIRTDLFSGSGREGNDFHIFLNPQYSKLVYAEKPEKVSEFDRTFNPTMDVLCSKTDGVINRDSSIRIRDLFPGYTNEGRGKIYVYTTVRVAVFPVGCMILGYKNGDFEETKLHMFAGNFIMALEKYQMSIKMKVLNEKYSELMQKDSLTSVKNRTAYDDYLAKLNLDLAAGGDTQISVLMCDINNLKKINDRLGHEAGDAYIRNCCALLCETFKHSPVFRIGGDEFVVMIRTADYRDRNKKLEEMRNRMAAIAQSDCSEVDRVSVATGMADFDPANDRTVEDMVKRADVIMYRIKAEMKKNLN